MSDASIQFKPILKPVGGAGFENGEAVLIYDPPPQSPALLLIESLVELGAIIPRKSDAVDVIDRFADEHGDIRAAEALAVIIDRLPDTKHGVELRLALLDAIASDADAAQAGVARQTLCKNVERIQKRLRTRL